MLLERPQAAKMEKIMRAKSEGYRKNLPNNKARTHLLILSIGSIHFKKDIILNNGVNHSGHKSDIFQNGFIISRGTVLGNLFSHLIDSLGKRLHSSENHIQFNLGFG